MTDDVCDVPPCPPRPDPDLMRYGPIDPDGWNAYVRHEAWWAHVDRLSRVGLLFLR